MMIRKGAFFGRLFILVYEGIINFRMSIQLFSEVGHTTKFSIIFMLVFNNGSFSPYTNYIFLKLLTLVISRCIGGLGV